MNHREIVLAGLRGEPVPRAPVVCPGGMMSFAVREAMQASGAWWPQAHSDPALMAALALETRRATGFDAAAVPFCMTVEAEALGAEVHYGSADVQPRIAREPMARITDLARLDQVPTGWPDRRSAVVRAIRIMREAAPELAILAATVGPFSLAAQVLEAGLLLRATSRQPDDVHRLLARTATVVRDFALSMVAAGADAVMVADPSATGEILGARGYAAFARPYLGTVMDAVRATGTPVILHVCGDASALLPALARTEVDVVSLDETANLADARAALCSQRLMGNLSARVLEDGPTEAIVALARRALNCGVNILAPACGVTPQTQAANLAAMARAASG